MSEGNTPPGDTPSFGLNGYVPLLRVWFSGSGVLNRLYNLTILAREINLLKRYTSIAILVLSRVRAWRA